MELLKDHEEMSRRLNKLHIKAWAQENTIEDLKRQPHVKLQNRLFKTQQRLFLAKQNAKKEIEELKAELSKSKALADRYHKFIREQILIP
jgi:uncharacterized coiled-coil protein SlyX